MKYMIFVAALIYGTAWSQISKQEQIVKQWLYEQFEVQTDSVGISNISQNVSLNLPELTEKLKQELDSMVWFDEWQLQTVTVQSSEIGILLLFDCDYYSKTIIVRSDAVVLSFHAIVGDSHGMTVWDRKRNDVYHEMLYANGIGTKKFLSVEHDYYDLSGKEEDWKGHVFENGIYVLKKRKYVRKSAE